ncbi:STELLO glycosyltransferase family protein [Synechocystis salina]|uniref:STELLO glycosyltransferase family protein n=1 Tax=Synechocystis salina TaxID=945780 RepID=UPI002AD2E0F8|nr:STELLO glycosyltransferase family protein [Synechocystis salina]
MNNFYSIVTTVQAPTPAVRGLVEQLNAYGAKLLVIGDQKGPSTYGLPNTEFLSLADQMQTPFTLAQSLPTGHYSRKNIGYLEAIRQGATCIYETDDDNAPLPSWSVRSEHTEAYEIKQSGWVNAYACFSQERIWPRGFPLEKLTESFAQTIATTNTAKLVQAPIQQGLANGSPDVDAVWRLVLDQLFYFDDNPSIYLPPGSWCPFNSQTTWWWPVAYPLMYLPSYCSFRMTDIWRSFIAQRCLWELDMGIVFHAPEVFQDRNEHNLLRDFEQEISGYLTNNQIRYVLEKLSLKYGQNNVLYNLYECYEALVKEKIFPKKELKLVASWLSYF